MRREVTVICGPITISVFMWGQRCILCEVKLWKFVELKPESVSLRKCTHYHYLTITFLTAAPHHCHHVYKSSAVAEMGDRGHNKHGPKRGGCCAPFAGGAGYSSNTVWPGPRSTLVPSGVFIHPAVWPQYTWAENWGPPFWEAEGAGSPSHTMWPGSRATYVQIGILIHPAVWSQGTWAENWRLSSFLGDLGPHLTQCDRIWGLYSIPSFILMHPIVWRQYTNVTDRIDRTMVR